MFLGGRRKPNNSKETHTDMGEQQLYKESNQRSGLKRGFYVAVAKFCKTDNNAL